MSDDTEHRLTQVETIISALPCSRQQDIVGQMDKRLGAMEVGQARIETKLEMLEVGQVRIEAKLTTTLDDDRMERRLRRVENKLAWLLGGLGIVGAAALSGLSLGIKWFLS